MKIRNGFVSNSSSSSFIVLLSQNGLEAVNSGLDEDQKTFFKYLLKEIDFDDKKAFIFEKNDGEHFEGYNSTEDKVREYFKIEKHSYEEDYQEAMEKVGLIEDVILEKRKDNEKYIKVIQSLDF